MRAFKNLKTLLLVPILLGAGVGTILARQRLFAAAPSPAPPLTVPVSQAYTLEELTRMVRQQCGKEVYVDRREQERTVFLSAGRYDWPALWAAVDTTTGLTLRQVGEVYQLAYEGGIWPWKGPGPRRALLSRGLLAEMRAVLEPYALAIPLPEIPFEVRLFWDHAVLGFEELPEAQQTFLAHCLWALRQREAGQWEPLLGYEDPVLTTGSRSQRIPPEIYQVLRGTEVHLGSSYLMMVSLYQRKEAVDAGTVWQWSSIPVIQIYYDYRDEGRMPGKSP